MKNLAFFLSYCLVGVAVLSGCASFAQPEERTKTALALAEARGWSSHWIVAGRFDLLAITPDSPRDSGTLTVYIEGDGHAWLTRSRPSSDPTPVNPLALRLALQHPAGNVAYLGRPCQYQPTNRAQSCRTTDWTDGRFSKEIVSAMGSAVNQLKIKAGAERIVLVGYSGGGVIATLVSAVRHDIVKLVTIAAPLDTDAWVRHHAMSPLKSSLNPAVAASLRVELEQHHFIGEADDVVPEKIIRSFVERNSSNTSPELHLIHGQAHVCCWEDEWHKLWTPLIEESADKLGAPTQAITTGREPP